MSSTKNLWASVDNLRSRFANILSCMWSNFFYIILYHWAVQFHLNYRVVLAIALQSSDLLRLRVSRVVLILKQKNNPVPLASKLAVCLEYTCLISYSSYPFATLNKRKNKSLFFFIQGCMRGFGRMKNMCLPSALSTHLSLSGGQISAFPRKENTKMNAIKQKRRKSKMKQKQL